MFTCINERDNIVRECKTLQDALGMATMCYDGAGIICKILDSEGNEVVYDFTPSCRAYVPRVN